MIVMAVPHDTHSGGPSSQEIGLPIKIPESCLSARYSYPRTRSLYAAEAAAYLYTNDAPSVLCMQVHRPSCLLASPHASMTASRPDAELQDSGTPALPMSTLGHTVCRHACIASSLFIDGRLHRATVNYQLCHIEFDSNSFRRQLFRLRLVC